MKTPSKTPAATVILATTAVGVCAALVIGFAAASGPRPSPVTATELVVARQTRATAAVALRPAASELDRADVPAVAPADGLAAKLQGFSARFAALRERDGGLITIEFHEAAQKLFDDMLQALREAPKGEAAACASGYLDSLEDTATGLNFVVGDGGLLNEAPSMRVAMLDVLAQVDPVKSVSYARKVLAESQSPDEWALAMRNLGWQSADGSHTKELRESFKKMLDNETWLEEGSLGFMKTFDVAVALGGPQEFEELASLVNLEDSTGARVENGVSQEARRALERMAANNPGHMAQMLEGTPDLLSWAPEERGSLMARADMADAAQRVTVEKYLQRDDLTAEEIAAFFDKFGGSSSSGGYSLLSIPGARPDFQQKLASDAAALAMVTRWQRDPRFQAHQAELQQVAERLVSVLGPNYRVQVASL